MTEHNNVTISRELLRQALDALESTHDVGAHKTDKAITALRAALEQPAVEPYGHVTVRRLSQRFENHVDQYTFYPAGHPPYLDNADECVTVYTAPQAQQSAQVEWGVDWGSHGDRSCVSVIKKHANGVHEIVATEYGPIGSAQQPRKAVKLTNEEIAQIAAVSGKMLRDYAMGKSNEKPTVFARALETAVLKKNGVIT